MAVRTRHLLRWVAPVVLVGTLAAGGIAIVHQPGDLIAQQIVIAGDPMTATISFTGAGNDYSLTAATGIVNYSGSISGSSATITVPTNGAAPGGTASICLATDGTTTICRNITVEK